MAQRKTTIKVGDKELEWDKLSFTYQYAPPDPEEIEQLKQAWGNLKQTLSQTISFFVYPTRNNAYHPTGTVVDATATTISEDVLLLDAPKQEESKQ